ncbi:MAG: protein translocase subunit SecD, partial [Nitrospirota bacterium]|nr:protein translocase subunit SecD [Nitrospirota bacterium]
AYLEFKIVDDSSPIAAELPATIKIGEENSLLKKLKGGIPPDNEILFLRDVNKETGEAIKKPILLKTQVLLTGDFIEDAKVNIDTKYNEPYVSISFNTAGTKLFEEITANNVKKRLAIIFDGTVYSVPIIQEKISGGIAQITGSFTMDEAKDLATILKAGALPAPVQIVEEKKLTKDLWQGKK